MHSRASHRRSPPAGRALLALKQGTPSWRVRHGQDTTPQQAAVRGSLGAHRCDGEGNKVHSSDPLPRAPGVGYVLVLCTGTGQCCWVLFWCQAALPVLSWQGGSQQEAALAGGSPTLVIQLFSKPSRDAMYIHKEPRMLMKTALHPAATHVGFLVLPTTSCAMPPGSAGCACMIQQ